MSFSVYIHLPYCLHKCPYCDFNTYAVNSFPEENYIAALAAHVEAASNDPLWSGRSVETVFFGGGTPSLFSAASLGRLLELVDTRFGLCAGAEITIEANPGSLEGGGLDKLAGFRSAGINRLSLGAQSFNARHLQTLGRIHSPSDTQAAIRAARKVGFESLSCDLMFAVPGQTIAESRDDLLKLIDFGPEHISSYNLTYEKGTPITGQRAAGLIDPADEDTERAMYQQTIDVLGGAGYRHYEISNFARPGHEARHNLTYWRWRDYLGVGAGAHGFGRLRGGRDDGDGIVGLGAGGVVGGRSNDVDSDRSGSSGGRGGKHSAGGALAVRYANLRLPQAYMAASSGSGGWADTTEVIDRTTAIAEFLLLGLRLLDGIAEADFRAAFGCGFAEVLPELDLLVARGLISHSRCRGNDGGDHSRCTRGDGGRGDGGGDSHDHGGVGGGGNYSSDGGDGDDSHDRRVVSGGGNDSSDGGGGDNSRDRRVVSGGGRVDSSNRDNRGSSAGDGGDGSNGGSAGNSKICLTPRGLMLADSVITRLASDIRDAGSGDHVVGT